MRRNVEGGNRAHGLSRSKLHKKDRQEGKFLGNSGHRGDERAEPCSPRAHYITTLLGVGKKSTKKDAMGGGEKNNHNDWGANNPKGRFSENGVGNPQPIRKMEKKNKKKNYFKDRGRRRKKNGGTWGNFG